MGCTNSKSASVLPKIYPKNKDSIVKKRKKRSLSVESSSEQLYSESQVSESSRRITSRNKKLNKKFRGSEIDQKTI